MQENGLFASVPIWVIFLATLLLVLLSVECGYRWGRWKQKHHEQEKESPVGTIVGAVLGLLAFLLAFTFGMAADHFNARKYAVVDEANAIRAAYLQAELVPEPYSTDARTILRKYVEERLQWTGVEKIQESSSSQELLDHLWAQTAAAGKANPNVQVVALFINSVNKVIDLHQIRVMARERSRIPIALWAVLFALTFLSFASIGYHGGVAGTGRSPVWLAVAIAFSIVIVLIVALDRPGQGLVDVSQQATVDLMNWMNASKP